MRRGNRVAHERLLCPCGSDSPRSVPENAFQLTIYGMSTTSPKPKKKRSKKPLPVLGWKEWISLPDLGVEKISVKVDTGAGTSSLYATNIRVIERDGDEFARFLITFGKPKERKFITAEAPLVGFRTIRSSSGEAEERPVIKTRICTMGRCWQSEITLTSRRMMQFPMLLGRACVRKRFLVDPSHSFLSSKQDLIP